MTNEQRDSVAEAIATLQGRLRIALESTAKEHKMPGDEAREHSDSIDAVLSMAHDALNDLDTYRAKDTKHDDEATDNDELPL